MQGTLIHHFLEQHAQRRPDDILVVDGRQQATYEQVDTGANRLAQGLVSQGVGRGDRVGLLAVNSRAYIEAYYGILKAGGIVVSLNAAGAWREHVELLRLCGAKGLVCGPRLGRRSAGIETLSHLEFVVGTAGEWKNRLNDVPQCRFVDRGQLVSSAVDWAPSTALTDMDRAAIVYTSGSTGRPKGVVLRHGNIVANTRSIVQYLGLTASDRVLVVLPFHYVYGKSLLNTHVAAGGSVVIENRFMFPQKALDTMEETDATGLSGVPSTFAILLNRSNFAERAFPALRYVTQAGGAMTPDLQRRLRNALPGKQIFIMYGATEASARLSYLDPKDLPRKIGSIGRAIPGVSLRVLREDGTEAGVGETGELVASGPNIMEGYWNDPDETNAVLDDDGYHTGDLGRRDEEGFLYVVGRKREMIKSGAHRISPKEIEEVLAEHPCVDEAAVVGVPDEILGEAIVAFVSAVTGENPLSDDLVDWCRTRLPSHKVPALVRVTPEFPRNAAGKINKLALTAEV